MDYAKKRKMDALHSEWDTMMKGLLSEIMSTCAQQLKLRGNREASRLETLGRARAAQSTRESFSIAADLVEKLGEGDLFNDSFDPPPWLLPVIELYDNVKGTFLSELAEIKAERKKSIEYQKRIAEALERLAPSGTYSSEPN